MSNRGVAISGEESEDEFSENAVQPTQEETHIQPHPTSVPLQVSVGSVATGEESEEEDERQAVPVATSPSFGATQQHAALSPTAAVGSVATGEESEDDEEKDDLPKSSSFAVNQPAPVSPTAAAVGSVATGEESEDDEDDAEVSAATEATSDKGEAHADGQPSLLTGSFAGSQDDEMSNTRSLSPVPSETLSSHEESGSAEVRARSGSKLKDKLSTFVGLFRKGEGAASDVAKPKQVKEFLRIEKASSASLAQVVKVAHQDMKQLESSVVQVTSSVQEAGLHFRSAHSDFRRILIAVASMKT
jgi:hypothetical protein